jgi:hypothetical protein
MAPARARSPGCTSALPASVSIFVPAHPRRSTASPAQPLRSRVLTARRAPRGRARREQDRNRAAGKLRPRGWGARAPHHAARRPSAVTRREDRAASYHSGRSAGLRAARASLWGLADNFEIIGRAGFIVFPRRCATRWPPLGLAPPALRSGVVYVTFITYLGARSLRLARPTCRRRKVAAFGRVYQGGHAGLRGSAIEHLRASSAYSVLLPSAPLVPAGGWRCSLRSGV